MYHPSLRISHIKFPPNTLLIDPCTLLPHHQVDVLDPGGPEAPAQQEHRPLRSETRERSAFLRLRFPTGHYFPHSLSTTSLPKGLFAKRFKTQQNRSHNELNVYNYIV